MAEINIIGSGLAGLSAAYTLAKKNIKCNLISVYQSERAQSVLAEGGINAALDNMNESDSWEQHFEDTMKAGVYLADPNAVRNLTKNAPETVMELAHLGVPFDRKDGKLVQRNFGGQKKKRTAYAKSSTGKMLMGAMIGAVRKYETDGLVRRMAHHEFVCLLTEKENEENCAGVFIRDRYTGEEMMLEGPVIVCCGGLNGMFPEMTTGTTANSSDAAAMLFAQGVSFGNLEMIQYHPTTIGIVGKRCLVSEAARGEGGRLYTVIDGQKRYFMEDKYPEMGNLMPRDVVSREEFFILNDPDHPGEIFLDMTGLSREIWKKRLPDLRKELTEYRKSDPAKEPVPVSPGIHYFMGGIHVDEKHRTDKKNLFAAGECCDAYHGANRLGGNSLLGAVYGGKKAALQAAEELKQYRQQVYAEPEKQDEYADVSPEKACEISEILLSGLGIVRNEETMCNAEEKLEMLLKDNCNAKEQRRIRLAMAMLQSARFRRESRGAHYRSDFPKTDETYRKVQKVRFEKGKISITQAEIPEMRNE